MSGAPSVASPGAERLANHGMELRTPLITAPSGRYQGAPALIPAVRRIGGRSTAITIESVGQGAPMPVGSATRKPDRHALSVRRTGRDRT
jgi:hypothetical protein